MRAIPLPKEIDPEGVAAAVPREGRGAKVALISMPFSSPIMPSLQLGLLKALLSSRGIASDVCYLNLPFARDLGYTSFHILSNVSVPMLGEWLFARAAFGPRGDDREFIDRFSAELSKLLPRVGWSGEDLLHIRQRLAPEYIDLCGNLLPWDRYSIVGFASSFQQNTAAAALARRIKERFPQVRIVFGGANFDHPMGSEYMRAFPWIDAGFAGEADESFPRFVERVLAGRPPEPAPGLAVRRGGEVMFGGPAPLVEDMGGSPVPDYDDFFHLAERLGMFGEWEHSEEIRLAFEGSRGCWWGEKSRCAFCGLRPETMKFRAKPGAQAIRELRRLSDRHGRRKFVAVDNVLGARFRDEICAELAEARDGFEITYEVKADLTREQLRKLKAAGVSTIQPGIESFSSRLLRLMKKGVTGLANVELLKWARYHSMNVYWNLLTGIPGEEAGDYALQADRIRALRHLPPPDKVARIRIERFSAYHERPGDYGFGRLRPEASYSCVYPPEIDLNRVAYFFEAENRGVLPEGSYKELEEEVADWQAQWRVRGSRPSLTVWEESDRIVIEDARGKDGIVRYEYSGPEAALYLLCETRKPRGRRLRHLTEIWGGAITAGWLAAAEAEMLERRLMINEGEWLLSLAVPLRQIP
ncbi:MAG: RiPP maturation radical SAM protein 1 [Deltaproteobacteria bacterium]|nr:RiPP maturation radical SAM protein 1 [Deltaproteobacteria bacterium]